MTQAQRLQKHIEDTRVRVAEVTGFSPDQLTEMFFEGAYKFLEMIGCTGKNATVMTSTTQFWNFWRRQWCEIDEAFLNKFKTLYNEQIISFMEEGYTCIGVIEDPESGHMWSVQDRRALHIWYNVYHECKLTNRYLNSTLIYHTYKQMKEITRTK